MLRAFLRGFLIGFFGYIFFYALFARADSPKAMQSLRQTAVRIEGVSCTGSGSIVEGKSGKHYLLTNAHVCNCAQQFGKIYGTFEGGEVVTGKVVKRSWESDLCAATVEDTRPALKLGTQLLPFTEVNTRGYPGGRLAESHGTVKGNAEWDLDMEIERIGQCPASAEKGYGINGVLAECRLHFTSTLTNLYGRPGSSGSAVVNDDGKLVGVVSSWHPGDDYDAGEVPFEDLRRFLGGL